MGLINTIGNAVNMGKVADTMEHGVDETRKAVNENTGIHGFNSAHQLGLKQGAEQAGIASQNMQSQVPEMTRNMAKAGAAVTGADMTASQAQGGMQQGYSTGYANEARMQSARISAVLNKSALANQQAKTEYATSQARLAQAQSALSTAVMFYNSNLKGMFSRDNSPTPEATGAGLNQNVRANLGNALGSGMTGTQMNQMLSDENMKKPVPATTEDALRQIESIVYRYTDEAREEYGADGDDHVGVTAQSVEKVWPEDVKTDGNGIKILDKQKLLESVTAGIAAMQKEIDELNKNRTDTTN